ncbi:hypothetical protein K8I61_09450 [bacterium]|nr:hypothetical protein [bacterium]
MTKVLLILASVFAIASFGFACAGDDDDDDDAVNNDDDNDDDDDDTDDDTHDDTDDDTEDEGNGGADDDLGDEVNLPEADPNDFDSFNLIGAPGGGWEFVEENCPLKDLDQCVGNTAPVVYKPFLTQNGQLVNKLDVVSPGDIVVIYIPYVDAECLMSCGSYYQSRVTPSSDSNSAGSLFSNIPCSSWVSDDFFGFAFGPVTAGHYSFMLRVVDACGAESERVEGEFDVK